MKGKTFISNFWVCKAAISNMFIFGILYGKIKKSLLILGLCQMTLNHLRLSVINIHIPHNAFKADREAVPFLGSTGINKMKI